MLREMFGYVVIFFVFVIVLDCKSKQIKTDSSNIKKMKGCSARSIRMWIDGKVFNLTQYKRQLKDTEMTNSEPDHNETFETTPTETGFLTSFRLPANYYNWLLRFPDFSIKSFNRETNTELTIPTDVRQKILITGSTPEVVSKARTELQSIIGEIRRCTTPTQFVAIPVHSKEIQKSFKEFKEDILKGNFRGVEESIFQSPAKLHLTVVVAALLDDREQAEAVKALVDCKAEVIDPLLARTGRLQIVVAGLDCMNTDTKRAHVLYANAKVVQDSDEKVLQRLADGINDFFYNRGLAIQYKDSVKLHVTLMNSKYRVSKTDRRKRWVKREPFDASEILERYKDFHFGESLFDSVHLSYMSSIGNDGFYKPLSVIKVMDSSMSSD